MISVLENDLTALKDRSYLQNDLDKRDIKKLDFTNFKDKQLKLKISSFQPPKDYIIVLNDFSFLKNDEEFIKTSINELIYFALEEECYIISLDDLNKIIITSITDRKIMHKLIIPFISNSNKTSILCIKEIPSTIGEKKQSFDFVFGTSNGLLYFYSLNFNRIKSLINSNINPISELKGIFSVFLNQFFDFRETMEKLRSNNQCQEFENLYNEESLMEDFLNKNSMKDFEPINFIQIKNDNLFAGLNSFIFKFNLKLNLLTQIVPSIAVTNKIVFDNENFYISSNSRYLLLFDSRGILISKYDTSLNCVFDLHKFTIKKRKV